MQSNMSYSIKKNWSLFPFTRDIALNDKYRNQFFPDRKVLWKTVEQLLEVLIKYDMFDCIGAVFTYLHEASFTLGPFWVRKLKTLNFLRELIESGGNQSRNLCYDSWSLSSWAIYTQVTKKTAGKWQKCNLVSGMASVASNMG